MPKRQEPARREARKPKQALPTLEEMNFPNHSKLTRPKKSNKQAIKRIRKGELLWDRKKVERAAKRRNPSANSDPRPAPGEPEFFLPKPIRKQMLQHMPSWTYDTASKAFKPINPDGTNVFTLTHAEELLKAFYALPDEPVSITVWNISWQDSQNLRKALPSGSLLYIHTPLQMILTRQSSPENVIERTVAPYTSKKEKRTNEI